MRLTTIGHAGLLIEAAGTTILCDPWFNPAFLGSWFPYPRNDGLDLASLSEPDLLYVSHLHQDHFDRRFLAEHVSKDTTVLLPDYPLELLQRRLEDLGFHRFLRTRSGVPLRHGGLVLKVIALGAPTDGPIGDSALVVDDGEHRVLDLNDARPTDLAPFLTGREIDVLLLQTSGAIWYPMVYDFEPEVMATLGRRKREAGLERALRLVQLLAPTYVVPFAGPPCFLDDGLWSYNDFARDPTNSFPDQTVFLDYLSEHGGPEGRLMVPGTVGSLEAGRFELRNPLAPGAVAELFGDKTAYLSRYRADRKDVLAAERASWVRDDVDVAGAVKEWFDPLLGRAERLCAEVGGTVLLDFGDPQLLIDFRAREVRVWDGEEWDHRFRFPPEVGQHLVSEHVEDWVNDAFLSCRFEASRSVPHNDAVFTFFKCLSAERVDYAESWLASQESGQETVELAGWEVQRRCPHGKADLARFGEVCDGVLTCHLHGYRYELATGACLTNPRLTISARRAGGEG